MEKVFDGNICRCTGYRPILDACKSLSQGADIEDLVCRKTSTEPYAKCAPKEKCFPSFLENRQTSAARFEKDGLTWVRAVTLESIFELLALPSM